MKETIAERIDDVSRSWTVVELLRALLLDGKLAVDERLNEVHLSRQFEVSRTPIRAALQTLAGEGLLEYTPNRGYRVRAFAVSEIVDAYEMRALAEGLAARLAAERGLDPLEQAEIENVLRQGDEILNATNEAPDNQRTAYGDLNRRFHRTIHEAAGSRLVLEVVQLCQRVPHASAHNIMAFEVEDVRKRHVEHHKIYEAILFREPKQAEALMSAHVLGVKVAAARSIARRELEQIEMGRAEAPSARLDARNVRSSGQGRRHMNRDRLAKD